MRTSAGRTFALVASAVVVAASAAPASAQLPGSTEIDGLPDVLVADLSTAEQESLTALAGGAGVQVEAFVDTPTGPEIVTLDAGDEASAEAAAGLLRDQPSVAAADLTVPVHTDAGTRWLYGTSMIGSEPALAEVDGPLSDVVVAVLDTGVHPHGELASALVPGRNVTTSPGGALDTSDRHGHGTHVAGTVGADAGGEVEGVAPGVHVMPVKVLGDDGSGSSTWVNRGIVWAADNGADVINLSLGGDDGADTYRASVDYARSKGVTVVAAAGNAGTSALHHPAAEVGVIGVAAVDATTAQAPFSTVGSHVDLAAPGDVIGSTDRSGGYSYKSGTSMATAHVAGAAALVKAAAPAFSPDQVEQALIAGAGDLGAGGRDDVFGHGLVSALRAVRAANATESGVPAPANRAPVPDDEDLALLYDSGTTSFDVLRGDADPDGDHLTVASYTQGARGAVDWDGAEFFYTPSGYGPFTDAFTYVVTDHRGGTATGTVHVEASGPDPSNHAPVAGDDSITLEHNAGRSLALTWRNDTDPDGDVVRAVAVSQPSVGTAEVSWGNVFYTPPADTAGAPLTSFEYTVSDGRGGFDTALVTVTVREPNRAPGIGPDRMVVRHDSAFSDLDLTANDTDPDGDPVTLTGVGTPTAGGTVTRPFGLGRVRYTPSADLRGGATDTFTYTVRDGRGGTATGTVEVIVDPAPEQGAPARPEVTGSSAGNDSVALQWSPGAGGTSPISGYRLRTFLRGNLVETTTLGAGSGTTVTGLTTGGEYTFAVAAINAAGAGPDSSLVQASPGVAVPGPPTITSAVPGDRSATVSWSAPADEGGSAVTGYALRVHRDGVVQSTHVLGGGARSAGVGLANGRSYTFTVRAINAGGTGPESPHSPSVTPRTVPAAPLAPAVVAGDGTAEVDWTAPADGGAPITAYRVDVHTGGTRIRSESVTAPLTATTIDGLVNGTPYTVTVTATNAAGDGQPSPHSAVTTPVAPVPPAAPAVGAPTPGDRRAVVRWSAPVHDGRSPITGYLIRTYRAGTLVWTTGATAAARSATIAGLTNGARYTFTVTATNAVGNGAESARSTAVVPRTVPGAPGIGTASALRSAAVVRWAAPAGNGGAAISGYVVRVYTGGTLVRTVAAGAAARSLTVGKLVPGRAYRFRVVARNVAGVGAPSALSAVVKPRR